MNKPSGNGAAIERLTRDTDGSVQSLLRALQLLEVLAEDDEGYRLVDLAARTGLSTSTTHRLLTTLEQKRFVQMDRSTNLWHVGVGCFSVGSAFARRRNIAALALPVMSRLRDQTKETVNLGLADFGDVVFLTQVESREAMRATGRPGQRTSMHCTAMGQAILASMPDEDVAQYQRTYGLSRMTPNTIARPSSLRDALEAARKTGYAIDDEENSVGLRCVAAAVHDEFSRPVAAISIAGPAMRVTLEAVPHLGAQVIDAARAIGVALGGRTPPGKS